ncbi:MAG: TlpA family protein disulfide reductase [Fidelibacterota bacterium]|nr:MAG: TlpA family protein disulfide reductase [Candidatus Neomarinimicrobiota bacterium]
MNKNIVRITLIGVTVILAALAGNALATGNSNQQDDSQASQVSPLAPDFTLRTLEGERITLSDLRGQVVLLNFWATWCGPCRREIPDLSRIYTAYKEKGVVILGVSWDDLNTEQIKMFAKNYKVAYPILHGTQSELSIVGKAYRWEGYLPTTYLIDREGKVRDVHIGARSERFFLEAIKPLL